MPTKNVNISIDERLLLESDRIVASGKYANRSRFIEDAIASKLKELDRELIGEQAKLLERDDAEEWFEGEIESWQEKY
jgi:metal-responsive CopG/Arc/MetJ family transcriptional regulator